MILGAVEKESTQMLRFDTRNEISQELAKKSIPRFVSPEESAVAPQKFKSRRQSLPQPMAGFELAKHSGRLDAVRTFSGRGQRLESLLAALIGRLADGK
jgi:hypothetical protein